MIEIREATAHDVSAIWKIRVEAILQGCSSHYTRHEVDAWANSPMPEQFEQVLLSLGAIVAAKLSDITEEGLKATSLPEKKRESERLLGFGFIDIEQSRLEAAFVSPSAVGMGIGALLTRALIDKAKKAGVQTLSLSSSLNAVGFYKKLGFKAIKETSWTHPHAGKLACVKMDKALHVT